MLLGRAKVKVKHDVDNAITIIEGVKYSSDFLCKIGDMYSGITPAQSNSIRFEFIFVDGVICAMEVSNRDIIDDRF